jgi:hypothetical protein
MVSFLSLLFTNGFNTLDNFLTLFLIDNLKKDVQYPKPEVVINI